VNRAVLAFVLGFAITFALVGVSIALGVPFDPGFGD
jgi:cytochrome c biogenesis protein CcdA